jgi:hypothetical protein
MGNGREGMEHLETAIRLYDPTRDGLGKLRLGPNPGVAAHAVLALLRWAFGYPVTAEHLATRVLHLGRELGHPYSLAYGTFHVAVLNMWAEQWEATDRHATDTLAIARDNEYRIWQAVGLVVGGLAESMLRDPQAGLAMAEQGIALYEDLRTPPVFWPLVLSMHARTVGRAGHNEQALIAVQQAIELSGQGPTTVSLGLAKADIEVALGDDRAAEATLWHTYELSRAADVRMVALQAAIRLARLSGVEGDPYTALRSLIDSFDEGLETPILVEAVELVATPVRL